jgi:Flp pilus assembly protein TadD
LRRADALQKDRGAVIFLGDLAGRRAYCLAQLGRWDEADSEARAALHAAGEDVGARYVVALVQAVRGARNDARATLDTLLAQSPRHEEALSLLRTLDSLAAGRGTTRATLRPDEPRSLPPR